MKITIDLPNAIADALAAETGVADVALFAARAVHQAATARLLAARKATLAAPDLRDLEPLRHAAAALAQDLEDAYPDPGTAVSTARGGEQ
jgi:hypothetical protein